MSWSLIRKNLKHSMQKKEIYSQLSSWFDSYQISELILQHTGLNKNQLFFCENIENFSQSDINKYLDLQKKWTPFEYIIQKAEFYGYEFFVDSRVLIPRNDTEIMVDWVLEYLNKRKISGPVLLDIWTWSSCIPISILKNTKNISECFVVDISQKALEVSKINIEKNNLEDKISQLYGSLLEPLLHKKFQNKDILITANLPYIKDGDFENMSPETVLHEPDTALYWGPVTWFELYETLIEQIEIIKKSQNINSIELFIEIWFDQKQYAQTYLKNIKKEFLIHNDNSGIARCIQISI